jgi:hypothetical protein
VREGADLGGVDHVAPEQDDAAHAEAAQQPLDGRVALGGAAVEADQQELTRPLREGRRPGVAREVGCGAAAGEREEEGREKGGGR